MNTRVVADPRSLTEQSQAATRAVLNGERKDWRAALAFAGPAVIASIAYMDPGNFATNIQAGAKYGYGLLWVVLLANGVAMVFQALSARLGIVTGRNLAELCRDHFSKPVVYLLWGVSEIAAMATDLAEFLGGAIGFSLLLNVPLMVGMAITAILSYGLLSFERFGFRPLELAIGLLVAIIGASYIIELCVASVDWAGAAGGLLTPRIVDSGALTIAVGIIGATIMPHALFLHSALTQNRTPSHGAAEKRMLIRFSNRETFVALAFAGFVNMAMVAVAAAAFHAGASDVAEIETAYKTLTPLLGGAAASVFLLALIASGLSSSTVGTMAGQMIMQGFVGFRIPVLLRRLITMIPAFVVVALGCDATHALVASQVVLSVALPAPMIALLIFTGRADIMGPFVNGRAVQWGGGLAAAAILALNAVLIAQSLGYEIVS
ncbi:divalent metal cation transporter [Rhodoblastus sphagnicola]|uniref:Divalent metal cation transporter MntH n=1 Tax=Rhodoblastus sphagnicola TaxID=333368 RepID=A0A2S6MUK9_9HYPH|nr:Nramp family divalent metal transporter [Rhodoblastus sphagnicola]MBB4197045.1 manganese transport protein [Rhodoblastus sphagnicola]PPQ26039.1 divalent metal cation transporter [Rhodoblastus sphagnicola]